jgi:hypothetical protein
MNDGFLVVGGLLAHEPTGDKDQTGTCQNRDFPIESIKHSFSSCFERSVKSVCQE